ncbi:MAG: hypothetical protein GX484_00995, partial [Chloroflexi bacterium]|nr:hypothetical protein [Chloroflexota bacterium]
AFGWLVGIGPGAGMALIFVFAGLAGMATTVGAAFIPTIRHVESMLPAHDSVPQPVKGAADTGVAPDTI